MHTFYLVNKLKNTQPFDSTQRDMSKTNGLRAIYIYI